MSQLFANTSTPSSIENLRASGVSIAVDERGAKEHRDSDHFNYQCHIWVDSKNEKAMKKVSNIATLQYIKDELAVFLCKTPSTEALNNLRTIGVSVNFD